MKNISLAALITVLATISSASAQVIIASYGLNDLATSSDSEANTTAGSFTTIGSSISAFTYSVVRQEGTKSAFFTNAGFNSATAADAITANDFVKFTIDVNSGYNVSFTNLNFYTLRRPTTGSGAPNNFAIRTSQDNYTATVATGGLLASALETDTTFSLNTLNLSSVSNLQSVTNSTEFRIYMWASQGIGGSTSNRNFQLDNLTVNGTVSAIPEPSSAAMLLGGAAASLALMARRRRKA
jgi:hypothetical protein